MHHLDPLDPRSKKSLLRAFLRIWWREAIASIFLSIIFTTFQFGDIIGETGLQWGHNLFQ